MDYTKHLIVSTLFGFFLVVAAGQHGAAATGGPAPAGVFGLELGGQWAVDDQAIVVIELFTRLDVAQRFDEHPLVFYVRFAIGLASVVDPAR